MCECNRCLCPLLGCCPFSTELVDDGAPAQDPCQAEGVSQLLSQEERFMDSRHGLAWIAKKPRGPSHDSEAEHSGVRRSIEKGMGTMPLRVIEGHCLSPVCADCRKLSERVEGSCQCTVGFQEE